MDSVHCFILNVGRRGKYRKKRKMAILVHIDLILHVHTLGAYVHMGARYDVSMIKTVARRTVH